MVVSAISGFSSRYSFLQIDTEYDEIKRRMLSLGITPSEAKSVDKSRLEYALKEKELEESQKVVSEQTKSTEEAAFTTYLKPIEQNSELISILHQLGLPQTDDLKEDYRKAINILRSRFMNESSMIEIARLRDLKTDLDRIASQYGYSTISIATSEMTGATTLGETNKVMMLQAGSFSASGK